MVGGAVLALASVAAAQAPPKPAVLGLGAYGEVVRDLDASVRFYRDVIGLEVVTAPGPAVADEALNRVGATPGARMRFARLRLPNETFALELREYRDVDRRGQRADHNDPGSSFLNIGVLDAGPLYARLRAARVEAITAGGIPADARPGGRAMVWVRDPDGQILELAQGGWDSERKSLVGVANAYRAHFGVTMAEARQALAFYRDLLEFDLEDGFPPLVKAGERRPAGDGMGRLLGVPPQAQFAGVHGHCASARCEMVEFGDASRKAFRPRLQDPGAAFLSVWVSDLDKLLTRMKAAGVEMITPDGPPVVVRDPRQKGWAPQGAGAPLPVSASRQVMVRDPAGFPILLMERME